MKGINTVMEKIDIHIHTRLPKYSGEGRFKSTGSTETMDYLNKQQIVHGIIMSMGETELPNNAEGAEIGQEEKNLQWNCNFDAKDPKNIFKRMEACKKLGAVGVGELFINEKIDSPIIQAIFVAAEQLELPILFHMSPEIGYGYGIVDDPKLPILEKALKKHPKLKLIGHSPTFWSEISKDAPSDKESRSERGMGKVIPEGRLVELMRTYPNLYGDLSAGSGYCAITRDEDFGLKFLETFSDQLLFGTDTISVHETWQSPLSKWLEGMYMQGMLSEATMRKICYENAQKIYNLNVKVK